MTQKQTEDNLLARWLRAGVIAILVLMPFHAPLTVGLSSLGLNYELVRLWKEILLVILLCLSTGLVLKNRKLLDELKQDWVVRLLLAWTILISLNALAILAAGSVSTKAVGFGLIVDTRMWLFLLVVAVAIKSKASLRVPQLIVWPAIFVIGFGLLQMSVLPSNVLAHLGYGADTILPFQAVDNSADFIRVQSTLRGPNPLAAYLIPVTLLLAIGWLKFRAYKWQFAVAIVASLTVLFGTYSRSGWIGMAVAGGLFLAWQLKGGVKKIFILVCGISLLAGITATFVLRDNDFIQNTIFHSSEKSPSQVSSNEARTKALTAGLKNTFQQPLGGGVGSSGPASIHNQSGGRIPESFYLQLGEELGLIGLGLYLAFVAVILKRLYEAKARLIVLGVLASFIGLLVVNLVSHAWADDTLAYIFGGLLAYGLFAYKSVQKANE